MSYKAIVHARDGINTWCGRFITVFMIASENHNCVTCIKAINNRKKMEHDQIYLTISGITYKMASRNLRRHVNKLHGLEYKVSKRHEGNFLTYVEFIANYGKKAVKK